MANNYAGAAFRRKQKLRKRNAETQAAAASRAEKGEPKPKAAKGTR